MPAAPKVIKEGGLLRQENPIGVFTKPDFGIGSYSRVGTNPGPRDFS